jgi:hypothetical protein
VASPLAAENVLATHPPGELCAATGQVSVTRETGIRQAECRVALTGFPSITISDLAGHGAVWRGTARHGETGQRRGKVQGAAAKPAEARYGRRLQTL